MRTRFNYFSAFCLSIALGIFSRSALIDFPQWSDEYVGDILWAGMVYFMFGMLFPNTSVHRKFLFSLLFSFSIEFSQLIQTPWMNEIRRLPLMPLVLGFGFKWSDLLCYAVGITIGLIIDILVIKNHNAARKF